MNRVDVRKQLGYSLAEIMIVIAIMGLMLAITAPAVSGYLRVSRLAGASNLLVADIHYARTLASEHRSTYEIRFGPTTYSLVRVSPLATITTRSLQRGVTCAASDTATFYAWGLTAPVTITMNNQADAQTIRLSATGGVSRD